MAVAASMPAACDALEHRTEQWIPLFGLIRCFMPFAGASVDTENRVPFSVRRASFRAGVERKTSRADPMPVETALAGPRRKGRKVGSVRDDPCRDRRRSAPDRHGLTIMPGQVQFRSLREVVGNHEFGVEVLGEAFEP